MSKHATQDEPQEPGHISNIGLFDLRGAQNPEDLQHITRISNVGSILIPEHLLAVLTRIPMTNVGTTIGIPAGEKIKIQSGQLRLSGEMFANGAPDEILLLMGQVSINSPVASVGYKEVWIYGQGFALRGSESTLGAKLGRVSGQLIYLPAEARLFMGSESIDREFLELLPEPRAFVVMGELRFAEDVTAELIKSKIKEIVLMGCLVVPSHVRSLVMALTPEKMGEIISTEEAERRHKAENDESDDDTDVQ